MQSVSTIVSYKHFCLPLQFSINVKLRSISLSVSLNIAGQSMWTSQLFRGNFDEVFTLLVLSTFEDYRWKFSYFGGEF